LVFFHGGGGVVNCIETHDAICRRLVNGGECIIVSVEYRLGPECKFPAALDDAYYATRWVADNAATINGDPSRIAVGGDSSGAGLAAGVALLARDRGGPELVYQLMMYPVTDYYLPGTPSYEANGKGYSLTKAAMIWFFENYLPKDFDRKNPYLFPLQAKDLSGLPPAHIITAEYDPLRDEGEQYAERLRKAGVPAKLKRYEGMMHGFIIAAKFLDKGKQGLEDAAAGLREAFA
jgi:acetyl esterase